MTNPPKPFQTDLGKQCAAQ